MLTYYAERASMRILELENRCMGNRTVGSNPTLSVPIPGQSVAGDLAVLFLKLCKPGLCSTTVKIARACSPSLYRRL
jgi:hypothetical protein